MAILARPIEPVENRLLAALPRDEYERLLPQLQPVSFDLGEVVYEFGGHLDYVYFPTTAIVSLLYTMENGVRREGVTVAAGRLQDSGAISYVRGHIKILDRKKLEATVCECYRVVRDEFDRLLGITSR
jgi:CRP-like cAMP-binding protein